jgi:hypothetical protein
MAFGKDDFKNQTNLRLCAFAREKSCKAAKQINV